MTGYLQRLVDTTPGILPTAPQPVVRSASPIAENDQRLALDPLAEAPGDVALPAPSVPTHGNEPVAPRPVARAETMAVQPAAAPAVVQRFQAPAPSAAAPPPAAPAPVPMQPSAPASILPSFSRLASPTPAAPSQADPPHFSPIPVIAELVGAALRPRIEDRVEPPSSSPVAKVDTPKVKSDPPAPPAQTAKPAATPVQAPAELAYVSPVERLFETFRQPSPQAPPRNAERTAGPEAAPPAPRIQQPVPAREIRETIREVVREVVATAPAPPRETSRQPKTAAEASVIGPLGSPYAASRRLALLLR